MIPWHPRNQVYAPLSNSTKYDVLLILITSNIRMLRTSRAKIAARRGHFAESWRCIVLKCRMQSSPSLLVVAISFRLRPIYRTITASSVSLFHRSTLYPQLCSLFQSAESIKLVALQHICISLQASRLLARGGACLCRDVQGQPLPGCSPRQTHFVLLCLI